MELTARENQPYPDNSIFEANVFTHSTDGMAWRFYKNFKGDFVLRGLNTSEPVKRIEKYHSMAIYLTRSNRLYWQYIPTYSTSMYPPPAAEREFLLYEDCVDFAIYKQGHWIFITIILADRVVSLYYDDEARNFVEIEDQTPINTPGKIIGQDRYGVTLLTSDDQVLFVDDDGARLMDLDGFEGHIPQKIIHRENFTAIFNLDKTLLFRIRNRYNFQQPPINDVAAILPPPEEGYPGYFITQGKLISFMFRKNKSSFYDEIEPEFKQIGHITGVTALLGYAQLYNDRGWDLIFEVGHEGKFYIFFVSEDDRPIMALEDVPQLVGK